jgi:hypothetical protein
MSSRTIETVFLIFQARTNDKFSSFEQYSTVQYSTVQYSVLYSNVCLSYDFSSRGFLAEWLLATTNSKWSSRGALDSSSLFTVSDRILFWTLGEETDKARRIPFYT